MQVFTLRIGAQRGDDAAMRIVVLVALVMGGCATGYHESRYSGGYSETRLNERTYDVRFAGNGYTPRAVVEQGAMRRACELTIRAGATHFLVLGGRDMSTSVAQPSRLECSHNGNSSTCQQIGGGTVTKPGANIRMRILTPQESTDPNAIDARLYLSQVAP